MNNSTAMRIHGCIPAVSVDEGKRECQVGVSREQILCECVVLTHGFTFKLWYDKLVSIISISGFASNNY